MNAALRFFVVFNALLLCLVAFAGCRRVDIREIEISTPGVRCEACADIVREALSGFSGVDPDRITVDTANGVTRLVYDSMKLALKNIEFAIIAAGFDANELPADPEARAQLPVECRAHAD